MNSANRLVTLLLAAGLAVLALFPLTGESFYIKLAIKIMALGIFAMSLDLLVGFTGMVSFGHAAFFGVAGYTLAWFVNKAGIARLEVVLPSALAVAALAALAIGWLAIRTRGVYFIMLTLALAQMLYYFFKDQRYWGGTDGINIAEKPRLAVGDVVLLDFGDRLVLYYFTLAALVGVFVLLSVILRSPFGRALVGIRENEDRMRALGYDVARLKLAAFVIAGTLAGLAGFIEASRTAFVNPAHLSWHESGLVLVMVLLGGMGTLYGPILGAAVLVLMEDRISGLWDHWLLVMGFFVIALVLFLPHGLAGMIGGKARRP
ncbi:MAG: branched-chain amino acid ABC transporter permease [Alphaproteobacteria bacterium]|nr:branched-chain amino acid ABC transporter permease [Alphaproteobacteria bacterium]